LAQTEDHTEPGKARRAVSGGFLGALPGTRAARAAPGTIKIGRSGVGSTQPLMGGAVDVVIDTGTVIRPQAEAGVHDILAIASGRRWPDAPDLPTVSETVAEGFDVVSWTGIGMPAGLLRH